MYIQDETEDNHMLPMNAACVYSKVGGHNPIYGVVYSSHKVNSESNETVRFSTTPELNETVQVVSPVLQTADPCNHTNGREKRGLQTWKLCRLSIIMAYN